MDHLAPSPANAISSQNGKAVKTELSQSSSTTEGQSSQYEFASLSFTTPFRKRASLALNEIDLWIEKAPGVREKSTKFEDIRAIIVLPTPASVKESSTLVISFKDTRIEPWCFNVIDDSPLEVKGTKGSKLGLTSESSSVRMLNILCLYLPSKGPFKYTVHPRVLRPEPKVFHSASPNVQAAARLKRKAAEYDSDEESGRRSSAVPPLLHTQAHLNRKDGYLFLLPSGWIVFGFKSPLITLAPYQVSKVIFQGIVSRTFDLQIHLREDSSYKTSLEGGMQVNGNMTLEMISIVDLPAVQAFVTRHLNGKREVDTPAYKCYGIEHNEEALEEQDLPKNETRDAVPADSSDDEADQSYVEDAIGSGQEDVPEEYQEDYQSDNDSQPG